VSDREIIKPRNAATAAMPMRETWKGVETAFVSSNLLDSAPLRRPDASEEHGDPLMRLRQHSKLLGMRI